jgi:hypothetical protein
VQDYLEQNVTKFLEKSFVFLIIDRVDELVTLFQQMGLERCVSLLAVPRAAIGRSQFGYYFPQAINRGSHRRLRETKEEAAACFAVSVIILLQ